MKHEIKNGVLQTKATNIAISMLSQSDLGIAFLTSKPNVEATVDDRILTVPCDEAALGKLYLILGDMIKQFPEKFGFSKS